MTSTAATTVFGEILRRAVEATPCAVGGAFADSQGEMVDSWSTHLNRYEWAIITATYGVVLAQLDAAFGLWHYGRPEYFIASHAKMGIVVHAVHGGYYALLAVSDPARVTFAVTALRHARAELEREMS
jgi:hypothetical protein